MSNWKLSEDVAPEEMPTPAEESPISLEDLIQQTANVKAAGTIVHNPLSIISGDHAEALAADTDGTVYKKHIHCSAAVGDGLQDVSEHGPVSVMISNNGQSDVDMLATLEASKVPFENYSTATGFWPGGNEESTHIIIDGQNVKKLHAYLKKHHPGFGCFAVGSDFDGTEGFDATGYESPSVKKSSWKQSSKPAHSDKYDPEQMEKGLKVEMEHFETVGNDPDTVIQIVKDHLDEDPVYYDKLEKVHKESAWQIISRIVKHEDGYHVLSEKGKNLGGPYESRDAAEKRLREVEYFKHQGAWHDESGALLTSKLADFLQESGPEQTAQELMRYYRQALGMDNSTATDRASRDFFWVGVPFSRSFSMLKEAGEQL